MSVRYQTRPVKALRVYCPVSYATLRVMVMGEDPDLDGETALQEMLSIIRGDSALGDFGIYKSVVELAPGWELFTPGTAARPALGEAGRSTLSPTVILTIYIAEDTPGDWLDRALSAIIEAHPWEVPVIELTNAMLLIRP